MTALGGIIVGTIILVVKILQLILALFLLQGAREVKITKILIFNIITLFHFSPYWRRVGIRYNLIEKVLLPYHQFLTSLFTLHLLAESLQMQDLDLHHIRLRYNHGDELRL